MKKVVSDTDLEIIQELIHVHPGETEFQLTQRLEYIFGEDITPKHYVALGCEIGYREGTGQILSAINTNLQLCQRQN